MGTCKLCHQESCLQESHILPNSIAKRIKSHGQTIVIYENKEPAFENSNFNYIEPMLCRKCEQILCKYESYGTNVTRNRKVVKRKGKEFIVFSVDFKRYYLYLISILWRAGITNHAQFTTVKMGESLLELMRNCIFNNKLIWNRDDLEDIISISIVKVNNEYEHLSDDALRKIVITPRLDEEKKETRYYYMMYDGFIFSFIYTGIRSTDEFRTKPKYRLRRSDRNKFPVIGITKIPVINNKLYYTQIAAKNTKNDHLIK